jgi:hypothetical protein
MAVFPSPYPLRDLFDAAVRRKSIKLARVKYRHVCIFDSHAVEWRFHKRG